MRIGDDEERFMACHAPPVRLSPGRTWLSGFGPGGGFVDDGVLRLVSLCRSFETLAGHAQRALTILALPPEARGLVIDRLRKLAEMGVLVSWSTFNSCRMESARSSSRVQALAVVTRGRPWALGRCLRSHVAHFMAFGRSVEIAVIDSSRSDRVRAETRAIAESSVPDGTRLHLPTLEDMASYVERLARAAQVSRNIVDFALRDALEYGFDAGANRNALLLALAGKSFLSTDDDMICEPHGNDNVGEQLRLTSVDTTREVIPFESFSAAAGAVERSRACILDAHERLLGNSVAALLANKASSDVSFDGAAHGLNYLLSRGIGRVAVTLSGMIGDSGGKFPAFYLWRQSVRDRLAPLDEDSYKRTVESRHILRTVAVPTISSDTLFMAGHAAFDMTVQGGSGQHILPPFFPIFRGEDLTFGRLLRATVDGGLIGQIPEAILHVPPEKRRASVRNLWSGAIAPSFAAVIGAILARAKRAVPNVTSGASRLQLVGRNMRELARMPVGDLTHLLKGELSDAAHARFAVYERLLVGTTADSLWARDLRRYMAHRLESLPKVEPLRPLELSVRWPESEVPERTRGLLRDFGDLLENWPGLVAAAHELNRAGEGLFNQRSRCVRAEV